MIGATAGHTNLAEYALGRFLKCGGKVGIYGCEGELSTRAKWAAGYTYNTGKSRRVP